MTQTCVAMPHAPLRPVAGGDNVFTSIERIGSMRHLMACAAVRIAETFPSDGIGYRKSRLISEIECFNHLVESDILGGVRWENGW